MTELASYGRRTLYQRGKLRRALLDTSVLTTDIIAATRRREPSSFVAGAQKGTVRCLIPVHVRDEVPRVLADRHREGGQFDLERALVLWRSVYEPVLYVVDTDRLPTTPEAQVLARRDPSDVPMLLLAGVIAPVVIIGEDKDLLDSGLTDARWRDLRAALGDVGVTEGKMADLERQASMIVNLTTAVAKFGFEQLTVRRQLTTAVLLGTVAGAVYWRGRKRARVPSQRPPVLPVLLGHLSTQVSDLASRHTLGEDRWHQAELGTPGKTLLHKVARILVSSREPLTRTAIVERLGDAAPGAGHGERMATVRHVLDAYPMFVDVTSRGHWQVGRLGGR
ncbi:PIN domain-containing protein [Streptomyces albidoflavus]|uniref:PIN domain-containing protein n=1 Tax=Streptomyces wadayamensis TaxID=141454 RepID=A0ABR4S5R0_9ACTN|nr:MULTISPECIES: PIN domain-containing protein [Streptomyces]MYQ74017.1 hypothetical protein [Streptomyces sp. SID4934]KDR60986.1 hypothetical protein DC60_02925 [Streptomyces wadayamensis]QXQ25850.1 hypothetical protein STALF2_14545 [Streptomyces albidoflavus]QXQ31779.1 hypothetical protein STALF4_14595 [Streptomyces albidoflavus]SCE35014.1 hypothetical protein GA0115237_1119135 [Streptomyces sp. ScaeMP-6W]